MISMISIPTPFTIKYDAEGKSFISSLRKIGFRLKLRGRNAHRKDISIQTGIPHKRLRQDVPLKFATHVAVYTV